MRVLLDTNVVLDVALAREPFYRESVKVLASAVSSQMQLFISASCVTDLYYLLSKEIGERIARRFLKDLLVIVNICPVSKETVLRALHSEISDFEDAVQQFAAEAFSGQVIVTRNKSDFTESNLEILEPGEFVARYLQ